MPLKGTAIVASVHTTVTIQAFNGLEPGIVGDFLCAYPRGGGLIERHECLFETTYSPGEDTYAR